MSGERDPESERLARAVLADCGATGDALLDVLLRYNDRPFARDALQLTKLPLEDEPHLDAWRLYAVEADTLGAWESLRKRFFQLQFPIEEGISRSEMYRAAVLRGERPTGPLNGLVLERPDLLELVIHPTIAGAVPILVAGTRADFVAVLRAFAARNEPRAVPDSMGASLISGLNNWDRIGRHRQRADEERGRTLSEEEWTVEFGRLKARPALYRDRFVLLSRGPYGATPASEAGLPPDEWLEASLRIRMNHEATHYVVARFLGAAVGNVNDELVADLVGLWSTFGRYDVALALRVLGVSPSAPPPRRITTYLGSPPMEGPALVVLEELIGRAAAHIGDFVERNPPPSAAHLGRLAVALTSLRLEVLASTDMTRAAGDAVRNLEAREGFV